METCGVPKFLCSKCTHYLLPKRTHSQPSKGLTICSFCLNPYQRLQISPIINLNIAIMRKRINPNAICSSADYRRSRKIHLRMLEERHTHFCNLMVSGKLSFDIPSKKQSKFKTITVLGKNMQVSIEEYNTHCKQFNL